MYIPRFKIVLTGAISVGKTSIANRFTRNIFSTTYLNTLGCDFYSKPYNIDGVDIKIVIFDIGGRIDFQSVRRRYLVNSDVVFIVFDLSQTESWNLEPYIEDVQSLDPVPAFALVGNKKDLIKDWPKLNINKIKELAKKNNIEIHYTSAKENDNIKELFEYYVRKLLKK
ncbi:MAG: Rab family GTPase [Promethearchaeota archaeon]